MARVDERQLSAEAKAEELLFLNCDASKTVVATTFAIEDSSGSEIIEVLRSLFRTCEEEGEEAQRIQELLNAYRAREKGISARAAHDEPTGWIHRLRAFLGIGD